MANKVMRNKGSCNEVKLAAVFAFLSASAFAAPTVIDADATLSGPHDAAAAYSVRNGATLTVKSRQAGDADAVLPQTLQDKATFWLDANKNLVTDTDGHIVEWLDARETDVAAPKNATKAIVQKQGDYPSDDLTVSTFPNGRKYVDFGEYNENKWMMFVRTDGGEATTYSRKRLQFRAAVAYLGFGKTAGFVFGDVADPRVSPGDGTQPDNARCIFHKGQGGSGTDYIYGPNTYAKLGETRKDGTLINPFSTTHTRNGWELFSQNGPYQVVASGTETPFASTLFNQGNFKAKNGYQDRQGGGKVAEIIYFTDVLTQAELDQVEAYLRHKWKDGGNVGEINAADGTTVVADTDESVWVKDVSGAGALEKNGADGTLRVVRNGRLAAGPLTLNAGKVVDWEKRVHRPLVALGGKRVQANATTVNVAAEGAADVATLATTSDGLPLTFGGVADGVTRVKVEKANLTLQPFAQPTAEPVDPRALVGQNLLKNGGFEDADCGDTFKQNISGFLSPWTQYAKNNVTSSKNASGGASKGSCNTWLGRQSDGPSYMQDTGCPEGKQFGFIQVSGQTTTNGLSQEVEIPADGLYRVTGWGRYRNRNTKYGAAHYSICTLSVLVDDTELLRHQFGPRPKAQSLSFEVAADIFTFQPFAVEFPLKKGSHTLHLVGTQPEGQNDVPAEKADRAIALDDIRLELVKPGDFVRVPNGGFDNYNRHESYTSTGALSSYQNGNGIFRQGNTANASAAGTWTFSTGAGIAFADGAWYWTRQELDAARRDKMVAFIQNSGTISQAITFPKAGKVCLQLRYANRTRYLSNDGQRPKAHNLIVSLGGQQLIKQAVGDDTMRLVTTVVGVEAGIQTLTIESERTDSTKDVALIVDDVAIEYVGLNPGEGATVEAVDQDLSEVVLKGAATASQTFTTTAAGPQLLTFRLRGKPLNPWGTGGTYQSHVSYTHLMSVTVDGTFVGQLYAQESERQVFELRTPYLAAGEHTVVFAGDANQENDACESRLSDVTLTPLTVGEMPDVSDVGIYLMDDKAKLNLDFSGTVNLKKFRVNGTPMHGTLNKDNCPAITGEGSVFVDTPGAAIILR